MSMVQGEQSLQALVMQYMPLVRTVSRRVYRLRGFDGIEFDDYIQFGVEGLIQALHRFDASKGASFETYATYRIRGSILSGLECSSEVNQQVATLRRLAAERLESITEAKDEKHDPKDAEQAFMRLLDASVGLAIAFMLEDTGLYVNEEAQHWEDGPTNLAFKQLQERLVQALSTLTEPEQLVIEGHYFHYRRFEDIGAALKVTKGRVSQIHRLALTKLRQAIAVQHLDELTG